MKAIDCISYRLINMIDNPLGMLAEHSGYYVGSPIESEVCYLNNVLLSFKRWPDITLFFDSIFICVILIFFYFKHTEIFTITEVVNNMVCSRHNAYYMNRFKQVGCSLFFR